MIYARKHPDTGADDVRDFDVPPPEGKGWRPLVIVDQPASAAHQLVEQGPIVFHDDGAIATWTVRDKTADELRVVVSPRQIRQALTAAGLRAQIEAGVAAADQDVRDWWEFATSIESDHPTVLAMCGALGITDAQRQQVFNLAESL